MAFAPQIDRHGFLQVHGRNGKHDRNDISRNDRSESSGNWEFDQTSKRYAITLNGEVTAYSIAKPTGICMLVKGDLGAADLRASWFSSNDDEPVDDDRERPSQSE